MHCPFCNELDTKVLDSRLVSEGNQVRRRRECPTCNERFTTYEVAELLLPRIIVKNDGRRVPFNEEKLRQGLSKALEKRPISNDKLEATIERIKHRMQAFGERELSSSELGEWVMDELRELDKVAYVRFASVYRNFADMDAFDKEIKKLRGEQ